MIWPDNKDFAFTIIDDTDHATVDNIKPIYDLLEELGLKTTKTVWTHPTDKGAHYERGRSLDDERYAEFIVNLQTKGFDIAIHGVRGCSSDREQIKQGLEKFKQVLGRYPTMHINHAQNKDNLYWGREGVPKWKRLFSTIPENESGYGHREEMPFYWGDLAKKHIRYIRKLVFNEVNTLKADPYMPYHDTRCPDCNQWFSSSDAADVDLFNQLLNPANIDQLEKEHGLCIAYTHFGDNFVQNGVVNPDVERSLHYLASKNGWFVPAEQILNYISSDQKRVLNTWQKIALWINYRKDQGRA